MAVEAPPCPHGILVPRWETVADMGIEAKATRYACDACHQEFTPEEANRIRTTISDVLVGQEVTTDAAKAAIEAGDGDEKKTV
ncbi:MAG TPA: hypothetical protein VI759_08425 [Dehalococcoidia bacterium]|nr:hypothetical protein [Dehalococcoidia bacterium]